MDKLIDRYVGYLQYERNASPHTIRNYASDLHQFRDFLKRFFPAGSTSKSTSSEPRAPSPKAGAGQQGALGDTSPQTDITTIDALQVRAYLASLFRDQKEKASIARKLASIRAFFKFMVREGVIGSSPCSGVATPKLA